MHISNVKPDMDFSYNYLCVPLTIISSPYSSEADQLGPLITLSSGERIGPSVSR